MPLGMLGKYERLDVLGHGASGIVYLAKDTLLGRQVALKEVAAQGDEKQKFLDEARVLDRLRHPNIVSVLGVDEVGGKVVIAMEYVRGSNLQDILRGTPQLPVAQAVSLAAQICDGLAFAHARRTVHRDIKPANVLVDTDGVVKLVDFGLAEVLGTNSFAGGAGTYAYMAPEDFHEQEQSDHQSDIWSVGVIFYEMLTGRRPFAVAKAKDPFAWKRAIEEDPLVPIARLRPDVPPALDSILSRALARDKRERYADASDMASDLRALGLPALFLSSPSPASPTLPRFAGEGKSELAEAFPGLSSPSPAKRGRVGEAGEGDERNIALLPLPDIDAFLDIAPDRWDEAREALQAGSLTRWLTEIGEVPLAEVAAQIAGQPDRTPDDKLREFLYRAGMETKEVARRCCADGARALKAGRFDEAATLLRRATRLNPLQAAAFQELAQALRALGDTAGAAQSVQEGLSYHPRQRALAREQAELTGASATLSASQVDFGVLRQGQSRTARLDIRNAGGGVLTGRIAAMPGWVRVEPSAFSTRARQSLTLTADTATLQQAPAALEETVVLETSGGRHEIPVRLNLLPARLGLAQIGHWFLPLLFVCLLPALVGVASPVLHGHSHGRELWRAGLMASGLLTGSLFILTVAANAVWRLRVFSLFLLIVGIYGAGSVGSGASAVDWTRVRPVVLQTSAPIFALLILHSLAVSFDPHQWGRWQLWRWIVGATAFLVSYGLWRAG